MGGVRAGRDGRGTADVSHKVLDPGSRPERSARVPTAVLSEPDPRGIRAVTVHGGPFLTIVPLPMPAAARVRHGQSEEFALR